MKIKIIQKGCEIHCDNGTIQTLISQDGWVEYDHAFAAIQHIVSDLQSQLEKERSKELLEFAEYIQRDIFGEFTNKQLLKRFLTQTKEDEEGS
jgi:hypothetical protein